jgi:hypothetical protein
MDNIKPSPGHVLIRARSTIATSAFLLGPPLSTSIALTRKPTQEKRPDLLVILHPFRQWAKELTLWFPNLVATHEAFVAIHTNAQFSVCSGGAGGRFSLQLGLGGHGILMSRSRSRAVKIAVVSRMLCSARATQAARSSGVHGVAVAASSIARMP